LQAQFAYWRTRFPGPELRTEMVADPFPDLLRRLEPICGRKYLLVHGGDWTAMFQSAAVPDMTSAWATVTERLGARAVLADALPNLYGRGRGANTTLTYADPCVSDEAFGEVRSLSVSYTEDGWEFGESGVPQPWENPSTYGARRVVDRFAPASVHACMDAIGIPPLNGPDWGPGGYLLVDAAPYRRAGWTGVFRRRSKEPETGEEPLAKTIAELHERMYGDL